jgi:predicted DNA-binding protein
MSLKTSLKTKQKRQASSDLVGFFLRVPSDIKARLDQKSKELGKSQAAVCVELIRAGLDGATVSTVSTLSTEGPSDLTAWLDRVK